MKRASCLIAFLAVLLAAPVFPGAAGAHVEMTPSTAPAGKPVNLSFEIPHGCDGAATTSLVVQIPRAAADATATAIAGWRAETAPRTLTWSGGPLPDHQTKDFPFRATLYGKKGDAVLFKTIQRCEGGATTAWIQAEQGGAEPEHPAPAVTLSSTVSEPAAGEPTATGAENSDATEDSSADDGGSGKALLLIVIAGLAIGTVAGIVVRARRNR